VVPVVQEPVDLQTFLTSPDFQSTPQGFIFYEEGGITLSEVVKVYPRKGGKNPSPLVGEGKGEGELLVLIGPEGGFTKEEVNFAEERGLTVISLGKRILKAETAAISAVTLVQYLFGDMG